MHCMLCGKEGEEQQFRWITLNFPEGEQKQCFCSDCQAFFEQKPFRPYTLRFQAIDGPSYSDADRPPFWYNEEPLDSASIRYKEKEKRIDLSYLPLQEFP